MHPSVRSDRPGACPICGMSLVRRSSAPTNEADTTALAGGLELSPAQQMLANVETAPADRRSIARAISSVGVITFAEPLQATVAARFRGRIEKLMVNSTGEKVEKGEPLFALYSPDLLSAEQEYLLAVDGAASAATANYITMAGMQQQMLAASHDRLLINFGLTEKQIDDLRTARKVQPTVTFHSPIGGTVIQKQVMEGQFVEEGMPLYQLADLSRVWAYLDLYENDLRFVRTGQRIALTADAYPGETFTGKVTFIDPVVNGETRTVRLRAEIPNASGRLKPNMFVRAEISTPSRAVIAVPSTAILTAGKRSIVWLAAGKGKFIPRDVVPGTSDGSYTEILDGLQSGERIAVTGGFLLDSESALQMPIPKASISPKEDPGKPAGHTGHNAAPARSATEPPPVREIMVRVNGTYSPETIRIQRGERVRLHFSRPTDEDCGQELVFSTLGIHRDLPAGSTAIVELGPKDAGEIPFSCGMGMMRGKIIVE